VDLDQLHLLGFEKRLIAKSQPIQLERLKAESQSSPETNESHALARALIGCSAAWVLIGIPVVGVSLALQLTVGLWSLLGWAGVVACVGMNIWRRQQSKRLLATMGL
jgi:uncharacterized membrane protein (DUF2068 family)